MRRPAIGRWAGGVRGQIVLTVLVVSAVLYSLLATFASCSSGTTVPTQCASG